MSYLDKTFCASPKCTNQCGRQMTKRERDRVPEGSQISYGYFCDVPTKEEVRKQIEAFQDKTK